MIFHSHVRKRDIFLIDGLTERECLASKTTVLLAYLPVEVDSCMKVLSDFIVVIPTAIESMVCFIL